MDKSFEERHERAVAVKSSCFRPEPVAKCILIRKQGIENRAAARKFNEFLHSQKSTGLVRPVTCPLQDVYHILVRDRWVDSTKQAVQIQPVNGLEIQPVSNLYHCSHV